MPAQPTPDPSADLLGHWKLDGNTFDSSRFKHHGRNWNAVFVESPRGKVIRSEGWGGRVIIEDAPQLNVGRGDFTLAFWVNPLRMRHAGLVAKGSNPETRGWLVDLLPNGAIRFQASNGEHGATDTLRTQPNILKLWQWSHIAVSVHRDPSQPLARIYVNGDEAARGRIRPVDLGNPSLPLLLFGIPSPPPPAKDLSSRADEDTRRSPGQRRTASSFLEGELSDLRFYRRALSREEIRSWLPERFDQATPIKGRIPGFTGAFDLKSGDVVVFTGGADTVRDRRFNYLEAIFTEAYRDRRIRFRNMGWEGDTVYRQLRNLNFGDWTDQFTKFHPTVIFAQFGKMESLDGLVRLPDFVAAYSRLLEVFDRFTGRIVLLAPTPFGRPPPEGLTDERPRNQTLDRYVQAIGKLAHDRGYLFVDLFTPLTNRSRDAARLTTDGVHLSGQGHKMAAGIIASQLAVGVPGMDLTDLRSAIGAKNRLWFEYWRPRNWAFLHGDRTHVPFSRDYRDLTKRIFPKEMEAFPPLIEAAEDAIFKRSFASLEPHARPASPPEPVAALDPERERTSFKLREGFAVNLFASEANGIVNPVQLRWDERGRLWVACAISYPQVKPGRFPNDRIVICEDTDHDGRADRFTTFVDGLFMPTGLELGRDGLYVCEGSELVYYRDRDGDDHADERRIVLDGFGTGDTHQMINSLHWGFGGDLWFTQGHSIYSRVETPFGIEELDKAGVWRFHPHWFRLDGFFPLSTAGENCWGLAFDRYGQVFHNSGSSPYGCYTVPGMIRTSHPLLAESLRLFQRSPKHTSLDIADTNHLPPELRGAALICGYYDNTLQAYQIRPAGAGFRSKELPDLIQSGDHAFRPVDVRVGPDGAIYLADWFNPIIGHYQASFRNPDRDSTHGRIWRIRAKDRALVSPPDLASASTDTLLNAVDSPEGWVRYQAKRLLFGKATKAVTQALDHRLSSLPAGPGNDYARLQLLSLYEAHEVPRPGLLKQLLQSDDFRIRAYATRTIGKWHADLADPISLLRNGVRDPHPRVRMEAVVAATYLPDLRAFGVALEALNQPVDSFISYALTQAVHAFRPFWEPALAAGKIPFIQRPEQLGFLLNASESTEALPLLRQLLGSKDTRPAAKGLLLPVLAALGDPRDLRYVFRSASKAPRLLDELARQAVFRGISPAGEVSGDLKRMIQTGAAQVSLRAIRLAGLWRVLDLTNLVRSIAVNSNADPRRRAEAAKALIKLAAGSQLATVEALARNDPNPSVRLAAIEAITRVDLDLAARYAVRELSTARDPTGVRDVLKPLLGRTRGAQTLAGHLGSSKISRQQARWSLQALASMGRADPVLVARLEETAWGKTRDQAYDPVAVRALVVAAQTRGDPVKGKSIFTGLRTCAVCHALDGQGGHIGPDLSAIGRGMSPESVVTEVLWPKRNVKEGFESITVTTVDGREINGYLQSQSPTELAIKNLLSGEVVRVSRGQIESQQTGGSVMPEGLTAQLSGADLVHLIRFLIGLGVDPPRRN